MGRRLGQRLDVGSVDQHVDLVQDGADGWNVLDHRSERLVRVTGVDEGVQASAIPQRPHEGREAFRLGQRLPAEDAYAVPLVGGVEQRVGEEVNRHNRATLHSVKMRHPAARAVPVAAAEKHTAPPPGPLDEAIVVEPVDSDPFASGNPPRSGLHLLRGQHPQRPGSGQGGE